MTDLDVINQCLRAVGVPPVLTVDSADAKAAVITGLLETNLRKILARGWPFNAEYGQFPADTAGQVVIPDDVLVFKPVHGDRFQVVGGLVRDTLNRTNTIDAAYVPMKGTAYMKYPIESVPEPVAEWIAAKTAVDYATSLLGASPVIPKLERDAMRAMQGAFNAYSENMLDSPANNANRRSDGCRGFMADGTYRE